MTEQPRIPLEIAVQDAVGALTAVHAGADRLELCAALETGGLTPSLGLVEEVAAGVASAVEGSARPVELCVLIRPRDGGFVFSPLEVSMMERDVAHLAAVPGVTGVVIGALTSDHRIDTEAVRRLVTAAGDLEVVFHRAIDVVPDPAGCIEALIALGCRRVLTSGGAATAPEGLPALAAMVETADGRLEIMAGGGVTANSIPALLDAGVQAIHLSAKESRPAEGAGPGGGGAEVWRTSPAAIREAREALQRARGV